MSGTYLPVPNTRTPISDRHFGLGECRSLIGWTSARGGTACWCLRGREKVIIRMAGAEKTEGRRELTTETQRRRENRRGRVEIELFLSCLLCVSASLWLVLFWRRLTARRVRR